MKRGNSDSEEKISQSLAFIQCTLSGGVHWLEALVLKFVSVCVYVCVCTCRLRPDDHDDPLPPNETQTHQLLSGTYQQQLKKPETEMRSLMRLNGDKLTLE